MIELAQQSSRSVSMEFQFLPLPLPFTVLLFLLTLLKAAKTFRVKPPCRNLPPGPPKLPLIGNLHQLVTSSQPQHTLNNLAKKYGPLMHLRLGHLPTVIVSSPEMAKQVMKTHDSIFANRPLILASKILAYNATDIAFSPQSKYWRQLKKVCAMELLAPSRVKSFRSIREEEVSNFINSLHADGAKCVNLSEKLYNLTYGTTSRAAFGGKSKDQEKFIMLVKQVSDVASGFSIVDFYPSVHVLEWISGARSRLEKMHLEIDRILENIMTGRKKSVTSSKSKDGEAEENLLDVLLKLQERGDLEFPLTDNNIKAVILDIFIGGSDTSSTTVEWAMSEMLKNPRILKEAQAEVRRVYEGKGKVDESMLHELKYLKLVIKETLRLHTPAPFLVPRESTESCEINGYEIPAETRVMINAWAIQRDPKYWTEPEKFYPERFLDSSVDYKGSNFEYIPFGAGRRMCPGIAFAEPNVELPLAQLLYHFDWKLPDGVREDDLDMTEIFGLGVRRKESLVLIPIPYRPLSDS